MGWTTSGYASASCKLGIQSEKFTTGDLTNFGDYLSSHRYSGWASAESPEGCGFKGWITENSFSRSSGTYDRTDTISGEGIDMVATGVYYLYTWTIYNGYVFPDIYIGSIDLMLARFVDASGRNNISDRWLFRRRQYRSFGGRSCIHEQWISIWQEYDE